MYRTNAEAQFGLTQGSERFPASLRDAIGFEISTGNKKELSFDLTELRKD